MKAALKARGLEARSFAGHLLHEPWTVETGQGGFYRVFTPFWRAVREREVAAPAAAPDAAARRRTVWPASDRLADWRLGAAMNRGAAVVRAVSGGGRGGGAGAAGRRSWPGRSRRYAAGAGPAGGGRHLAPVGEPDLWRDRHPRRSGMRACGRCTRGRRGRRRFLKELVWREFAYHLMHHTPHITSAQLASRNGTAFPGAATTPDAERWRRGMTGEPFVDAAMREMYVTGTMHNRARMIAASYLTKHLMTALEGGAGLVRRLPDRLGPGGECDGLAMGGGVGAGCGALFPGVQPGEAGREVRPERALSPPLHRRTVAQPRARGAGLFRRRAAVLGA